MRHHPPTYSIRCDFRCRRAFLLSFRSLRNSLRNEKKCFVTTRFTYFLPLPNDGMTYKTTTNWSSGRYATESNVDAFPFDSALYVHRPTLYVYVWRYWHCFFPFKSYTNIQIKTVWLDVRMYRHFYTPTRHTTWTFHTRRETFVTTTSVITKFIWRFLVICNRLIRPPVSRKKSLLIFSAESNRTPKYMFRPLGHSDPIKQLDYWQN